MAMSRRHELPHGSAGERVSGLAELLDLATARDLRLMAEDIARPRG